MESYLNVHLTKREQPSDVSDDDDLIDGLNAETDDLIEEDGSSSLREEEIISKKISQISISDCETPKVKSSLRSEKILEKHTIVDSSKEFTKQANTRSPKQAYLKQCITIYMTPPVLDSDIPSLQSCNDVQKPPPVSLLRNVPKYHFSRYFLRQLLVICQIKPIDADNAVTSVKEFLVNSGLYHITQWQLEQILFDVLVKNHVSRSITPSVFRVVNRFQASRGALIIVVTGTPCFGRPVTPLKLAERLNVPNVVRTAVVANVLSFPKAQKSIPEGTSEGEMLENFKSICKMVHMGLSGDLEKARNAGKSVLFEGLHIDPQLYLDLFSPINVIRKDQSDGVAPFAEDTQQRALISAVSTSSSSSKAFPVVVVPFLLVGQIDSRQIRQSQGQLGSNIDRPLKALQTIESYLRQFENYMNVIHVESSEVSEHKLDEMHQIVLQYLQSCYEMGGF